MRAIDFAAIVTGLIAAAPISAAAETFIFTYTFNDPSPLLGYINEDGSSLEQINSAVATLNSIPLHAAANATWSGGAGTDINEATYTITLGGFHFSMIAEKEGNGSAGAMLVGLAGLGFAGFRRTASASSACWVTTTSAAASRCSATRSTAAMWNCWPRPSIAPYRFPTT